jgi:hypothetical protein
VVEPAQTRRTVMENSNSVATWNEVIRKGIVAAATLLDRAVAAIGE